MTITVTETKDFIGNHVYVVKSTSAKLNRQNVLEALEKYRLAPQILVHVIQQFDEMPMELYDKGDVWELYDPEELYPNATDALAQTPAEIVNGKCPVCGESVKYEYRYCPACGQRLQSRG